MHPCCPQKNLFGIFKYLTEYKRLKPKCAVTDVSWTMQPEVTCDLTLTPVFGQNIQSLWFFLFVIRSWSCLTDLMCVLSGMFASSRTRRRTSTGCARTWKSRRWRTLRRRGTSLTRWRRPPARSASRASASGTSLWTTCCRLESWLTDRGGGGGGMDNAVKYLDDVQIDSRE